MSTLISRSARRLINSFNSASHPSTSNPSRKQSDQMAVRDLVEVSLKDTGLDYNNALTRSSPQSIATPLWYSANLGALIVKELRHYSMRITLKSR